MDKLPVQGIGTLTRAPERVQPPFQLFWPSSTVDLASYSLCYGAICVGCVWPGILSASRNGRYTLHPFRTRRHKRLGNVQATVASVAAIRFERLGAIPQTVARNPRGSLFSIRWCVLRHRASFPENKKDPAPNRSVALPSPEGQCRPRNRRGAPIVAGYLLS